MALSVPVYRAKGKLAIQVLKTLLCDWHEGALNAAGGVLVDDHVMVDWGLTWRDGKSS